ncbi:MULTISPECIES: DUF5675 family protein [Polaribacter]|jgi:hypothetical protein|uniref:DUF5675 domain-containing protein n=1 Tax=Polaribacter dokdonensis DSW-5 TaxID=1300348 RepID=A0A0N0CGA9_9FLAO|nr:MULTISPECIES: DUF5675 family protein [Polaribacter]KOY53080.1 hypothetical protein I602_2640 [Polaribacter dokdonensis DSW-5]UAM98922.1 DUF5675 family protein [Polaribacter litorisediminis]SEE56895.1 hypothetical protein SAMN05444353_2415 [Polaribacter dokdonensis DSW-5]|tara:strand:+ start:6359 stop:6787 length:429 start_codon:yes stop_codon:yes gene_type:complete
MILVLHRTYFPEGTQGILLWNGQLICYTIELPWIQNEQNISCVPEGLYNLQKRYSQKFQHHIHLQDVPGRSLILLHPANDAIKELEGCIAPVSYHTGIGKGNLSRKAFHKLTSLVLPVLAKNTPVQLRITSSLSYFKSQLFI